MPNQPDKNKRILSIQIRRELYAQLSKLAKQYDLPLSVTCRKILEEAAEDVELTEEDYEKIRKDIARLTRHA